MADDVVRYMCPVTKTSYSNPFEPRRNYLQNQWELSPDQIFEYCALCDIIEAIEQGNEVDPTLLDMLKLP